MIKRNSKGQFVKGSQAYWKGKKFSPEYRKKLSEAHIGIQAEDKHPLWKGQGAGYGSLHIWVSKHLGKPSKCEHCNTTTAKRFEWANVSGEYYRDLNDWIRLCKKCHHKFDNISEKIWHSRGLTK